MHQCSYCQATFTIYADLVTHKETLHKGDWLGLDRLRTHELLAAEGMVGHFAGSDMDRGKA